MTLRFLGGLEEAALGALRERLAEVPGRRFEMELDGLGGFGGRQSARVVFLGLRRGGEEAAELATAVEAACRAAGLEPEDRPFRPHVTLARARERRGAPAPALPGPPALEPWPAEEMVLFASRFGQGPAIYEPLARFPLGEG